MRACLLVLLVVALVGRTGPARGQSAVASWSPVTEDVNGDPEQLSGYHIYYGTAAGGPYPDGFSTGQVTETTVTGLANGQTYYFVVTAVDAAGNESEWSNQASYTVPYEDCDNLIDDDHDGLTDCQDDECAAAEEDCDGFDNDCNGTVDDNLDPPDCPLQAGVCQGATHPCGGVDGWQACGPNAYGADYEAEESRCDGLDNDCDGATDEELTGPACPLQMGVCAGSRRPCQGAGGWGGCDASVYGADYEADETRCDDLDNDCDGSTDEGCPCSPGQSRPCSTDEGVCVAGEQVCDQDGNWGACSGVLPADEECDGLDNDCDGQTDEDEDLDAPPCGLQQGECAGAVQRCGGGQGWLACEASDYGDRYEDPEQSCDGLDNDCDGLTDEDGVCAGDDGGVDAGIGDDAGTDGGTGPADESPRPDGGMQPGGIQGSCGCDTAGTGAGILLLCLALASLRRRIC